MNKKLLAVVAHPDDETFGFGGTLAKYAKEKVEIHVLCATKGENGEGGKDMADIREKELREAAKIGIKKVEFMGYLDGHLCNNIYHEVAERIDRKIKEFNPQVVITFDRCQNYLDQLKLFYFCLCQNYTDKLPSYFIYFPPGYKKDELNIKIDISSVWDTKVKAMYTHKSQTTDVKRILKYREGLPKKECFVRAFDKDKNKTSNDLFSA